MDRKLQRHRADSLRQHGFLVYLLYAAGRKLYLKMARIDKEKLAFEVEKYVFLYDKSNAKYKDRKATDQAWAAVASELGIEGNSIV